MEPTCDTPSKIQGLEANPYTELVYSHGACGVYGEREALKWRFVQRLVPRGDLKCLQCGMLCYRRSHDKFVVYVEYGSEKSADFSDGDDKVRLLTFHGIGFVPGLYLI